MERDLHVAIEGLEFVLGHQQHATGSGAWVVDGAAGGVTGQTRVIGGEQDVHHEGDRVTRGVKRARAFTLGVERAVHDVLEHVAHRSVGEQVRVHVDTCEVLYYAEEPARALEGVDLVVELERAPDVGQVVREGVEVSGEGGVHVVVVAADGFQIERGRVVERQVQLVQGAKAEHTRVDVHGPTLGHGLVHPVKGFALVRQHALDSSQHSDRDDVVAVFFRLNHTAQIPVCGVPYGVGRGAASMGDLLRCR
ncbi:hypothetical protein FRC0290_01018 [Corynebacterium diphtheriae]|nr:hypothetical protein FRC0290_01018 [Corynebacterium diphtheriae]CAB1012505.1 hypothetical protein FRC0534_01047 [Corynebacterium diphtheriae]CAB1014412.1 hypothetical protein FRC0515_01207 [Corynebacterium diphtheriae]CAB1038895.1 hypothetical protein FRC0547_01266 [Corynebacterium diphtheriae]